jgi:hypothetical protein
MAFASSNNFDIGFVISLPKAPEGINRSAIWRPPRNDILSTVAE